MAAFAGARRPVRSHTTTKHCSKMARNVLGVTGQGGFDFQQLYTDMFRVEALYVVTEPLVNTNRIRLNTLALNARLPTIHGYREYVETGGLMSYGANLADLWRRASDLVDKILRGIKPGDIPVEQPTKFELFVNLKAAKALGLTIPEAFLLRADKLIE